MEEARTFVGWLYEQSEATSWEGFARAAGVSASNISKYHGGTMIPDGYNLLRLMRAAGVVEGHEFRPQEREQGRLEELVAAVDVLATEVRENSRKLEALAVQVAEPQARARSPRSVGGSR